MRQGGINRQSVRVGGRVAGEGREEEIPGPSQLTMVFLTGTGPCATVEGASHLIALACQN